MSHINQSSPAQHQRSHQHSSMKRSISQIHSRFWNLPRSTAVQARLFREPVSAYLEDTEFFTSNASPFPTIRSTSNLANSASLPYATVPSQPISRRPSALSTPQAAPTDIVGTPTPGKFQRPIPIPL